MAGIRFAVVLLSSSSFAFGFLLLAASASSSSSASRPPATVYNAGEEWRAAPASNDGTHLTLILWAMRHRFYVGDVLDFKRSNDSVLLVSLADFERCSAASPPARRFADGGGGDTRLTLGHPGLLYFISGEPARCEAGQRMILLVRSSSSLGGAGGGGGAPTPAPATAPGPGTMGPTDDVDSPSGDRPIPVWFKLVVPAVLGFLSGSFFAGVILCICMNLRRRRRAR